MFRRKFSRRVTRFRRKPVFGRSGRAARRNVFRRRRTVRRRPVVSRRRILNVSTVKKSDAMPPAISNTSGQAVGVLLITGSLPNPFRSLFLASARTQYTGTHGLDHNRQSQHTFAVGYKENTTIDIVSNTEWYWRRIVFAFKGDVYAGAGTAADAPFYDDATSGMTRLYNTLSTPGINALQSTLFQGTFNIDWLNEEDAKVDVNRVTLIRDTSRYIKTGTNADHSHRYKLWYPIKKDLVYNDIEFGKGDTNPQYVSVASDHSVGDIYVYDYFRAINPSTTETVGASITSQGQWYWHER